MKENYEQRDSAPKLIVMLTYHDMTVKNACEIFAQCRNSKAQYFGFKEKPLPEKEMKELFAHMKACGKKTVLEIVEYTEEDGLKGAMTAAACGCDILMGTCYFDSIRDYCEEHGLLYMPFIGQIEGRPSVLRGNGTDMAAQAKRYFKKGVFGCDLLGYRYVGDAVMLNRTVIAESGVPICIAGSVNNYERLDEIIAARAWGFTIGSAFFDHCFGESFSDQINAVCDYVERESGRIYG